MRLIENAARSQLVVRNEVYGKNLVSEQKSESGRSKSEMGQTEPSRLEFFPRPGFRLKSELQTFDLTGKPMQLTASKAELGLRNLAQMIG